MKLILSFLLAVTISTQASAATQPKQSYAKYGTVIGTTALSASSTSFAVNLDSATTSGIWGLAIIWVTITDASNSVTAIHASCTSSRDGGTTDFAIQDCATLTDGVCTSVGTSWVKDPSGITSPKRWVWRGDIEGLPELECTFTDTGGDGSDFIKVELDFATKG
jgi:hypothetical protein